VYNSLSVVSTLAGGTIATLLQMTYNSQHGPAVIANIFLILSLVLSLATAILCQLANYSIISNTPPPSSWRSRVGSGTGLFAPIVFFVAAVIFLFSGLIAFAFTLFPNGPVPYVSIGIVALVFVGIGIAVLWVIPRTLHFIFRFIFWVLYFIFSPLLYCIRCCQGCIAVYHLFKTCSQPGLYT